jgi:hypothetical protein
MGRGRQKAKHTKVARELKYFSPDTNYNALERELTNKPVDPRLEDDLAAWPEYASSEYAQSAYEVDDEDDDDSEEDSDEEVDVAHKRA